MPARRRRLREVAIASSLMAAGAGLIATLDVAMGRNVSLASLYTTCVVVGAWRWGRLGAATAIVISLAFLIATNDPSIDVASALASPPRSQWWTVAARGLVYVVVGFTVAALRTTLMERDATLAQLQAAMAELQTLRGLLPICAWCKHIRDDEHGGAWVPIETYVAQRTDAEFTHGICPKCAADVQRT